MAIEYFVKCVFTVNKMNKKTSKIEDFMLYRNSQIKPKTNASFLGE